MDGQAATRFATQTALFALNNPAMTAKVVAGTYTTVRNLVTAVNDALSTAYDETEGRASDAAPKSKAATSVIPDPVPYNHPPPQSSKKQARMQSATAGNSRIPMLSAKAHAGNERPVHVSAGPGVERVIPHAHPPASAGYHASAQAVYPSMSAQPIYVAHVSHSSSAPEAPRRFRNYYPKEESPRKRKRRPRAR
jgi:hypothetical protein